MNVVVTVIEIVSLISICYHDTQYLVRISYVFYIKSSCAFVRLQFYALFNKIKQKVI